MTRLLDAYADVLPYGLQPTPFGEVWRALQAVASTVWDVDPAVYRAGIAWGWYVQHNPDALAAQRDLVIAALISEQAPLIKADQTTAELVEYLRQWREYRPTYDRLEALYKLFAADVEIMPISTPGAPPVSDTRLAFYVRIFGVDFSRLLTLEEAYTIAIRATPLGSRPIVYYEFEEQLSVDTQPLKAGIASITYENDVICEPVELNHYTFIVADATTGQIVSGFSNELTYGEIEGIILQSPRLVYGVDINVPTAQFWFTDEGRNEQDDSLLPSFGYDIDLYNEDGTRASGAQYAGAYPLAYMKADGNMFTYGDDRIIVNSGVDLLGLESEEESNRSAWSVFVERVFTLSFANTQLPGITITMPTDETGYKGTSITLPTMSGEYESGGKTWKPSAWDIGAFGDSYTLNADTVAHLIFEEVQQYQEITLYFSSSSNFAMQGQITSGFTGNVNSAYIYQLYTDAEHTTPWNGYDYSNDYEIGYYSSGSWVKRSSVQEMPDSTSAENSIISWILLDTGYVWGVSNIDTASRTLTFGNGSIIVRIYPKGQQWIPAFPYNSSSGEYDNLSTNHKRTFVRMGSPATVFGTFPAIAESFGYKSGMIKSASIQAEFQIRQAVLYLNVVGNPSLSNIVVRFENDIYTGYVRSDKADLPTSPSYDGATYTLKDDNGNNIDYDDSFTYKFVLLLNSAGEAAGGANATGSMIKSSTGKLQVRIRYSSSKFNRVWYYRILIS